ncbi:hypothetical protein [Streptomyces sp. NPDC057002]|uniref:nSTAND1 domain-containing NTPase n=1 Tax=Streptomyces sp. NPDC057002 TaxID=3345992 RepID=UPI003643C808
MSVDVPFTATGTVTEVRANVVEYRVPERAYEVGGIALLRLQAALPDGRPLGMADAGWPSGHALRVPGFPRHVPGGCWFAGRLDRATALGPAHLLLDAPDTAPVDAGFNGSPVWDTELGAVIGMAEVINGPGGPQILLVTTLDLLARLPELLRLLPNVFPFRGLSPFTEADATVFHGRRAECSALVSMVAHHQWTAVVGPSGSGKTSLVLAGVVPRLRETGTAVAVLDPASSQPLIALAAALLPLVAPDLPETDRIRRTAELAAVLAGQGLAPVVTDLLTRTGSGRLLIVIDQLDKLLALRRSGTETDEPAHVLFADSLPETVRVLTTLRSDAVQAVLAHPRLGHVLTRQQVYQLGQMDADQLRQVVDAPNDSVPGLRYEPGLSQRILGHVGAEPGRLPSLGLLLEQLWRRQRNGLLTHQAYDQLGGVTGALSTYAEQILARFARSGDMEETRRLFTRLVRIPWGTGTAMPRTALCSELGEEERHVAQRLVDARLLVIGCDAEGTATVELAHASLITDCPRLARWVAENREFLTWRESLRHDMERWKSYGRAPGLLPEPETLEAALGWLSERGSELSAEECDYLEAGRVRRRVHHRWRQCRWIWAAAAASGGLLIGNRLVGSGQASLATAVAGGVCTAALGILGYMLWSTRRPLTTTPWHRVQTLAQAALLGYVVAYLTGQPVVGRPTQDAFSPSETAQVVTAIGALVSAVGMSAAAVIRAVALLIHARNDAVRARAGLPPADQTAPDQAQGAEDAATQ